MLPDCENCVHLDCPRDEDEVRLCALLLKLGVDFSKISDNNNGNGNGSKPKLGNGNKSKGVEQ